MADVVCLGILVADVWGRPVNDWPERGRLSLVDEVGIGVGGCAANTGVALAKLGGDVAIMGKVGVDGFGDFVTNTLREAGADISGVVRDAGIGTSATLVMIDDAGERTFIHYPGANARLKPEELDLGLVKSARIFHLAGTALMPGFDGAPAASVLKAAQDAGVTTCMDTAWDATGRWMSLLGPQFEYADICTPSFSEAVELTGLKDPREVAGALLDLGPRIVALKMGEEGSYVRTADTELSVPAFNVNVVDGTGAGDAFVAGFLRGVLEGWDLERTATFANATGGLCAEGLGTSAGLRSFEGTLEFIAEQGRG